MNVNHFYPRQYEMLQFLPAPCRLWGSSSDFSPNVLVNIICCWSKILKIYFIFTMKERPTEMLNIIVPCIDHAHVIVIVIFCELTNFIIFLVCYFHMQQTRLISISWKVSEGEFWLPEALALGCSSLFSGQSSRGTPPNSSLDQSRTRLIVSCCGSSGACT